MSVYDCISHLRWGYWAAAQTRLRDFIPQTPFFASRRFKEGALEILGCRPNPPEGLHPSDSLLRFAAVL